MILPLHDWLPLQLITQLAASAQLIALVQALSPHSTSHAMFGGQVIAFRHWPDVQSNLQTSPTQVPPATVQGASHGAASGEVSGASPVSGGS